MISLILLVAALFTSNQYIGYFISLLIIALISVNWKSAIFVLIIYFPIRPFLIEMNPGLKYLGDGIICVLFFLIVIQKVIIHKERFGRTFLFSVFFLLFCLIGVVSAFITGVEITSIIFQIRAFVLTFLCMFIISELKITEKDIAQFFLVTVCLATVLSVHGLIEKLSLRTLLLPEAWVQMDLAETNRIRIYGLAGNPNILATYLMISFFSVFYLIKKFDRFKPLLYVIATLIFGVVLLTYSRGTILSFAIAYLVFIAATRQWKLVKSQTIVIAAALFIIFLPTAYTAEYIENYFNDKQLAEQSQKKIHKENRYFDMFSDDTISKSTEGGRIFIIKKGIEIFKEHPLIGTGFGTYGDSASWAFGSPILKAYGIQNPIYSDNQYIQILVQSGVVGALFFFLFFVMVIITIIRSNREKMEKWIVLAFLIVGATAAVFYNILEDKTFTLYFYIVLGFLLNKHRKFSLPFNQKM
ncbi:O-antigen ligase family protein [Aeribacillus sp. FSL W8-0870]|uniref:O-antigen ligase family protein n=1 Tax=Aeribacillus sp. FSL W8-0870 TaxID=2954706 RepID=UPI0030CBD987